MFVTARQLITNIEATLYLAAKYVVVLHVVKKLPCRLWTHNRVRNIPPNYRYRDPDVCIQHSCTLFL